MTSFLKGKNLLTKDTSKNAAKIISVDKIFFSINDDC